MLVFSAFFGFAADSTSSASTSGGGYVTLDPAVRDLYSREILFEAQPRQKFVQFAKKKVDFQAVKGKSIIFTKYNNLTGGSELTEGTDLEKTNLSASEITITVKEQGKAIQVTEFLLQTSFQDIMGESSRILANHLATSVDTLLRNAALETTNILFGDGSLADATAYNGADGNATAKFNTATVKTLVERLASNNSPRFEGDYFVCFATPSQLRSLRDDNNWIEANKYNGRRQLYVGEAGMYEGMIFIETTNMPIYATAAEAVTAGYTGVTNDDNHEAVAFGENAYAWGVAVEAELRDDGVQDFGRKHGLAWYGIWGAGILEDRNVFKVITQHA